MMEYITETADFRVGEPAVVTISLNSTDATGCIKLLKQMLEVKAERGLKTAVFTFDMTPPEAWWRKRNRQFITTNLERRNNLEESALRLFNWSIRLP